MESVAAGFVSTLIEVAQKKGARGSELLAAASIPQDILSDPFVRISAKQFMDLIEETIRQTHDEALGLHIGERMKPGTFNQVGYAATNSMTLGSGLELGIQYQHLITHGVDLSMISEGERVAIRLGSSIPGKELSRVIVEMGMVGLGYLGRVLTGKKLFPQEATFQYDPPAYLAEYHRIFQCPLRFKQPFNQMIIDQKFLALPFIQADPALAKIMKKACDDMLATMPNDPSINTKVRQLTLSLFQEHFPNFDEVAFHLGMSPRTLRRRLREEHTSFQEILDETRKHLSLTYLKKGHLTIQDITTLLGYSEPSAFHRSFKKWTGQTPGEYRDQEIPFIQ